MEDREYVTRETVRVGMYAHHSFSGTAIWKVDAILDNGTVHVTCVKPGGTYKVGYSSSSFITNLYLCNLDNEEASILLLKEE